MKKLTEKEMEKMFENSTYENKIILKASQAIRIQYANYCKKRFGKNWDRIIFC